jgi:hypothetical protein
VKAGERHKALTVKAAKEKPARQNKALRTIHVPLIVLASPEVQTYKRATLAQGHGRANFDVVRRAKQGASDLVKVQL